MKTPTVLRPRESVPPVKAGCRGFDGAWMPPSDHPNISGFVGLGGHHLTAHRNRLHAGSPPPSAHSFAGPESAVPGTDRRVVGPRGGPHTSCRIAGVAVRGVCVNPTNARTLLRNEG